MNRRRFLAALLATPVGIALAPLLPKSPPLMRGLRTGRVYTAAEMAPFVSKIDMSDVIYRALKEETFAISRGMRMGRESPQAQGMPTRFEWQEDS